ncbi:Uncharacterised protein [Serratia liquefaciens]|nr:Uncharacterised protein [Serratia liquefaciens]
MQLLVGLPSLKFSCGLRFDYPFLLSSAPILVIFPRNGLKHIEHYPSFFGDEQCSGQVFVSKRIGFNIQRLLGMVNYIHYCRFCRVRRGKAHIECWRGFCGE